MCISHNGESKFSALQDTEAMQLHDIFCHSMLYFIKPPSH